MKTKRKSARWVAAALAALTFGGILGGTIPANAVVYGGLNGSVSTGTYKYYYNTWRPHTLGYASWTLNSYSPSLYGGSLRFALWDGTGGETSLLYFNSTGVNKPFAWPGGGNVLPTQTYAVIDGSDGACGGSCTVSWTATLNL